MLLVAFLLVTGLNCHLSRVLASVVQGDAVDCNNLLLRILRYMWRNHVDTWAQANNSGRNLDLNKIQFSHLHYILQYSF